MKNIFDLSKNGAKKIYIDGTLHPIKVGMREISLQNGKKVCVYDTTGAYTDDNYQIDIRKGMPKVREPWIKEREKEGETPSGRPPKTDYHPCRNSLRQG